MTHLQTNRKQPDLTKFLSQWTRLFGFIAALVAGTAATFAADLKPETVQQWEAYVKSVDARQLERLAGRQSLLCGESADREAKLRSGAVVVTPGAPHVPIKAPSGLIHDWLGAAFIPNASVEDVVPVVRDYDHYKEFYRPNVLDSRRVQSSESVDRFSMVIMNKSVVAKTALDADYRASYTRVAEHLWYSVADSTRIQEIAEYDTPSQHMLAEDHGTGFIWRVHSITRFEERDGGVYVEFEAMVLSRDVPAALRWMVDPIVRRVSRSSVETSLRQTEAAVRSHSPALTASRTETKGHDTAAKQPAPASPLARSLR